MPINSKQIYIDSLKEKCLKLFNEGLSALQISRELGVGYSTLKKRFREWNFSNRTRRYRTQRSKEIDSLKDVLLKQYQEGKSIQELSRIYGINASSLRVRFKGWGITIRKSQTYKSIKTSIIDSNKDRIIEMYLKQNKTLKEIADIFHLDSKNLGKRIRKWGIRKAPSPNTHIGINVKSKEIDNLFPQILEYYNRHKNECTYASLSKRFGISETTVRTRFKNFGIKLFKIPKLAPITQIFLDNQEEIIRLYTKENWTLQELSIKFKISKSTLQKKLNSLNCYKTKEQQQNILKRYFATCKFSISKKELQELYIKKNLSARKIAELYNVDKNTIMQLLKHYNMDQNCIEKYNVPYYCMTTECVSRAHQKISKPNLEWKSKLEALGYKTMLEFRLNDRFYDLQLLGTKYLIELNPTATHNSTINIYSKNTKPKSPLYHQQKSKLVTKNGYHCVHIWDWDKEEDILQLFRKRVLVPENTLNTKVVLQKQSIKVSLYSQETEISYMIFEIVGKKKYRIKKWEWLNTYFNSKGLKRILDTFIDKFCPEYIEILIDYSKFSSINFEKLNFKLKGIIKPQVHLIKGKQHIIPKTSKYEPLIEEGFVEVYDCGYLFMTWNKKDI